ncbi:MAG: phosphodiester glycosidase family protein [Rubricoccaceae bacterium]|nr:phosphodiester glycosidase family protein [Rubricoccaceae bacterium]
MAPRRAALLAVILVAPVLAGCRALAQAVEQQTCALDGDDPYTVVRVDPAREWVRLYWRRDDGTDYRSFEAVREAVDREGLALVAATNAGIYEPGFVPTGLWVEEGETRVPLNTADGRGNFFLKPNGVFVVGADRTAAVVSTDGYVAGRTGVERVWFATQSGPLLVNDGALHPSFGPASTNCRTRTGVGVTEDGQVVLAISNGAVNFYDFARHFRDVLGTPNALYLDGGFPTRFWAPRRGRIEDGAFAGVLAVVRDLVQ